MDNKTQEQDWTASSLARAAGVGADYVARLCRNGKIPAVKVGNAVWVITNKDGLAWLALRPAWNSKP